MIYEFEPEPGRRIRVENAGGQTVVHLSSHSAGQQQSQGTGFVTGEWSAEPALFRRGGDLLLRLHGPSGTHFLQIRGGEVRQLSHEPDLAGAERAELRAVREAADAPPMEPMKPLEPLPPLQPMRPMEMRMGNMHLSMGGAPAEPPTPASAPEPSTGQRFCTQCGKAAAPGDRFCGGCGQRLADG